MKLGKLSFIVLATSMLLTACASVPNIALEKNAKVQLKSIALLKINEPQLFRVSDYSGVSGILGMSGGLIQASIDKDRATQVVNAINDRKIRFGDIMAADLNESFKDSKISLNYLSDQSARLTADGKTDDYSQIVTDADAILSIWYGSTGYVNSAKIFIDFQPQIMVNARLLDAKTKKVIYQKTFNVGYELKFLPGIELMPADPKYKFGDFEDVMKRIDFSIEALTASQKPIADRITADIKM